MKIVQTFWSGKNQAGLANGAGWKTPEYHWFSWALSVHQLRQFYDEVELITDKTGKQILIDTLRLPYTSVQVVLDELNDYPALLWALAKIHTYSLQTEPFLHIDGDIYIWKPFENRLLEADLVAQNLEIDFRFYNESLKTIKEHFNNIPSAMLAEFQKHPPILSANAGVIGGRCLKVFKELRDNAFRLVDDKRDKIETIEAGMLNICLEQFLFYCLSQKEGKILSYVIENQEFDPTYPNYANFFWVPFKTWYIHTMANYKTQEPVLRHLAKRLRRDYPETYYQILKICIESGMNLHNQIYQTLSSHFINDNCENYHAYLNAYECGNLNRRTNEWLYFYVKDCYLYQEYENIFGKTHEDILQLSFIFDSDCEIEENYTPELEQKLIFIEVETLTHQKFDLEPLDMVLLDCLQEPQQVIDLVSTASLYYTLKDINENIKIFENLIISRLQGFWYMGAIKTLHL